MKAILLLASATSAFIGVPASAEEKPTAIYTARYDAARDRYCITVVPKAGVTLVPTIVGKPCFTQAQWRKWGLTVSRKPAKDL